jgi:hypothetical protein
MQQQQQQQQRRQGYLRRIRTQSHRRTAGCCTVGGARRVHRRAAQTIRCAGSVTVDHHAGTCTTACPACLLRLQPRGATGNTQLRSHAPQLDCDCTRRLALSRTAPSVLDSNDWPSPHSHADRNRPASRPTHGFSGLALG